MTEVYEVPPSEGRKKVNRFAFRVDGKVYTVPKTTFLSGRASKFVADNDSTMSHANIGRGILAIECPPLAERVYDMDDDQISKLLEKWFAASGLTTGESDGSDDS